MRILENSSFWRFILRMMCDLPAGRDVIAQAQSGTGKTSMIALALCQTLETNKNSCAL